LADLVAGDFSAGVFTQIGISSPYSIAGFDTDAGSYFLLLESNENEDPGDEVFLLTYDSLADLIAGDFSAGVFTQIGISSPYSIAGFDARAGAYHVLLESNENEDPGDEVFLLTYDSLADLIAGDFSAGEFTQIGISSPYSIAGFLSEASGDGTGDVSGTGSTGTVPEPATLSLFGIVALGVAARRLRR
jgi:hypothetical protein